MLKKLSMVLAVLFIGASSAFAAESVATSNSLKVAMVDLQGAILQTNQGKSERDKLEKDLEKKRKELMEQQNQLKKMNDEFLASQALLSEADKQTKQREFQEKVQKFQKAQVDFEQNATERQNAALSQILKNMQTEVQKIALQKKYDMVFDKSAGVLLFSQNAVDITSDVVTMYNTDFKVK